MKKSIELIARLLLGHVFLLAGVSKLGDAYAMTAAYMERMGLPAELLPATITLEIIGGLMIILGFKTKWAAYTLAVFSIIAGIIFHSNFADQMQMILFMKNTSIAGGLILLGIYGAGTYSIDNKFQNQTHLGQ